MIGWLASKTYYTAFVEGWALYAENPLISNDTDTYKSHPMYKYGMLKAQVSEIMDKVLFTQKRAKKLTNCKKRTIK